MRATVIARDLVLGIDTSTRWLNLALVRGGEVVCRFREEVPTHATRLAPEVAALLDAAEAPTRSIAAVGVVCGPGSFTGLRVGLASALGFARALEVPVYGLDTLTALVRAYGLPGEGAAVLDARRREVYWRRYASPDGSPSPLGEAVSAPPAALEGSLEGLEWAVGDGVPLVTGWPASCRLEPEIPNMAIPAALNALAMLASNREAEPLEPLYVRPPDVRPPGGAT